MSKLLLFLSILTFSLGTLWGQEKFTPPAFELDGGKLIWMDIQSAHYQVLFSAGVGAAKVSATISFKVFEKGLPFFDLVPNDYSYHLEGEGLNCDSKNNGSSHLLLPTMNHYVKDHQMVRVLQCELIPGEYQLSIKYEFTSAADELFLKFRDREPRNFLELYFPTNFEFDHYPMTFEFRGLKFDYLSIFSNASSIERKPDLIKLEFDEFFTASSPYLHFVRGDLITVTKPVEVTSISGKKILVQVYTQTEESDLEEAQNIIVQTIKELEKLYGSFPYERFIYNLHEDFGGMEYPGAAYGSLSYIRHELFHQYFGRGVFPADGNAGAIDEGLAAWFDRIGGDHLKTAGVWFHYTFMKPRFNTIPGTQLDSPYNRTTHRASYQLGAEFFEEVDRLSDGRLNQFLKHFYHTYKYQSYDTELFMKELCDYLNLDLSENSKYLHFLSN